MDFLIHNTGYTGVNLDRKVGFVNEATREQNSIFVNPSSMENSIRETARKIWDMLPRQPQPPEPRTTSGMCSWCEYLWDTRSWNHDGLCEWHGAPSWRKVRPVKPRHHIGNGKPKGLFAGTLTMSPKWDTNEEEMVSAIEKIFKQKTVVVKRFIWFLEYTADGTPHIHFIYETEKGGRITQQVFKRAWKWWDESETVGRGHKGGYHKHCHAETEYLDYISKDKGRHNQNWPSAESRQAIQKYSPLEYSENAVQEDIEEID